VTSKPRPRAWIELQRVEVRESEGVGVGFSIEMCGWVGGWDEQKKEQEMGYLDWFLVTLLCVQQQHGT